MSSSTSLALPRARHKPKTSSRWSPICWNSSGNTWNDCQLASISFCHQTSTPAWPRYTVLCRAAPKGISSMSSAQNGRVASISPRLIAAQALRTRSSFDSGIARPVLPLGKTPPISAQVFPAALVFTSRRRPSALPSCWHVGHGRPACRVLRRTERGRRGRRVGAARYRSGCMKKFLLAALLIAAATLSGPVACALSAEQQHGGPQAPLRASLPDIEDEVMCPTCGVPLALAFSPQAERERQFIRDQIDRGRTKQEIKDALVAEFG